MSIIIEQLEKMEAQNASDVFITVGGKISMRILSKITEVSDQIVTQEDFELFFKEHLPANLREAIETDRDLDIGISLSENNRYRLNVFYQKSQLSLVARRVPSGAKELTAYRQSEVIARLAQSPRGSY